MLIDSWNVNLEDEAIRTFDAMTLHNFCYLLRQFRHPGKLFWLRTGANEG